MERFWNGDTYGMGSSEWLVTVAGRSLWKAGRYWPCLSPNVKMWIWGLSSCRLRGLGILVEKVTQSHLGTIPF